MADDELQLLSAGDVAQILEVAWLAFDDLPLERVELDGADRSDVVCASIAIEGPRHVEMRLVLTPTLARRFATAVLGSDYHESTDDDVRDVLGELANVIGGNYKGAIGDADAWALSFPTVSRIESDPPRSGVTAHVGFLCDGELIECLVLERV
jgi:chemotaxis protein CheX